MVVVDKSLDSLEDMHLEIINQHTHISITPPTAEKMMIASLGNVFESGLVTLIPKNESHGQYDWTYIVTEGGRLHDPKEKHILPS